jgi:hypothetical protein
MFHGWFVHWVQVHCAVERALLLRCTLDETAAALEAAGIAPAVFTKLGESCAPFHSPLGSRAAVPPAMWHMPHPFALEWDVLTPGLRPRAQCGSSWRSRTRPSSRSTTKHSQHR